MTRLLMPRDSWFSEVGQLWEGQAMSIEIVDTLLETKTKFQDLKVYSTKSYGNMLVLDGVIQLTERDEFAYQEMIAHLPLCAHPNPERVLIIGGGDGGVLREVARHPRVAEIHMCEIDEGVIVASRAHFPTVSCSFNDPRLQLTIGDGSAFLDERINYYDVIITDSSDPIGPASTLFEKNFFRKIQRALKPRGIMCCQGECIWLHLDLIRSMMDYCRELGFASVQYAYTTIPTYPSGQIGFLLCSNEAAASSGAGPTSADLSLPIAPAPSGLRYYNSQIHGAAFILPEFARQALDPNETSPAHTPASTPTVIQTSSV